MEEGSMVKEEGEVRGGVAATVGFVGEVLTPQGGRRVMGEWEVRESDKLITAMEEMEVGG